MKSQQIQTRGEIPYEKVGHARDLAQELLRLLIKEFVLI